MAFFDGDDLDVFFDTDEFVVSMTHGTATYTVIFDNEAELYDSMAGQVVTTTPTIRMKTTDAAAVHKGDTVAISGVNYKVITPAKPDGTGISMFGLQKV